MDEPSRYAEKLVLYALLGLAVAAWFGIGGLVFVGILQDAAA